MKFEGLEKDLKEAGIKEKGKEYFFKRVKYSVLFSLTGWFSATLMTEDAISGAVFGVFVFASGIALAFYYPKSVKRKKAEELDKDLPFSLMNLAIDLSLGTGFEKAIERIAEENNEVGKEFGKALKEMKSTGASMQKVLIELSERTFSKQAKRAIAQIVYAYEKGSRDNGYGLKRIAEEMLSIQRTKAKEFSGKMVVYSLMFVAVSAIVPALFLAFIIVGSSFLEIEFTSLQVFLTVVVGFPALDVMVLYYIRLKTPVFLKG